MAHPSGTMARVGPPCLCTPALLQVRSEEGGVLSTRLAWGSLLGQGALGAGLAGPGPGWHCLSCPLPVSSASSTAHLLTGTWLLGWNSPLQPCPCSLLMLLDVLGLVWRAHGPWPPTSHSRVTLWHEECRHSPSHCCVPTDRSSSRAWWGPAPRDLPWEAPAGASLSGV